MRELLVQNLGRLDYESALKVQHQTVRAVARGECRDTLLLVEHPAVFTLGRRRSASENVLNPGTTPVVQVERGGDVTWHGPGQLVGYPIVALGPEERDVHRVLRGLEESLVTVLSHYGLEAEGGREHTGVWVGGRKIASVGVAIRDWVTFHGFALNVDPDLSWFARINPCGLGAEVMTSMADLGLQDVEATDLREQVSVAIAEALCRRLVPPAV